MKKILLVLLLLPGVLPILANTPPRLVINLVVSSMRPDDIDRYRSQFGTGGFLRLTEGGARFTEGSYDYQQTSTPVSLATLTTGAMPSTHGVISTRWRDYIVNKTVGLIDDPSVRDPEYYHGNGAYSPRNLIAPTVGEALLRQSPDSRSVTVALDPISAVVMGGREGMTFWMDSVSCNWTTSTYYLPVLPAWVKRFNADKLYLSYIGEPWHSLLNDDKYRNKRCSDIVLMSSMAKKKRSADTSADAVKRISSKAPSESRYDNILYSPAGNCLTLQFAKTALTQLDLGKRDRTDLLNICLDAPRAIREAYGPESIEAEDMYYRLDQDLEEFLTYVYTLFKPHEVLVILTSDHGSSPSYDFGREACDRFNTRQFEVIVNGFLSARYGPGNWVLEYEDKCLYLNHNLVYEKDLSLADIQNEVATFAMQFRGVSHALSATAMRTSYFGSGYARKMQNSFYPRRSGDVIINLMPGWIEEHDHKRSSSGSMYGYDTRVPLIFYGAGILPRQIGRPDALPSARYRGSGGFGGNGTRRSYFKQYLTMANDKRQDEIIEEFSVFDEWLDKYEYLIGLSDTLPAIAPEHRTDQYLIQGCQSRVWIDARYEDGKVWFTADSDAIITKGIIALLIRVLGGRTPQEILDTDLYFIDAIGLSANLSPTRSNGLLAMIKQMRLYALAFSKK